MSGVASVPGLWQQHWRSHQEAERLVREFERSGLTRRAFCWQHGLSPATLDGYRHRYGSLAAPRGSQSKSEPHEVSFIPVDVVEKPGDNGPGPDAPKLYVEMLDGRCIGVSAGFDAATLKQLFQALEQC